MTTTPTNTTTCPSWCQRTYHDQYVDTVTHTAHQLGGGTSAIVSVDLSDVLGLQVLIAPTRSFAPDCMDSLMINLATPAGVRSFAADIVRAAELIEGAL